MFPIFAQNKNGDFGDVDTTPKTLVVEVNAARSRKRVRRVWDHPRGESRPHRNVVVRTKGSVVSGEYKKVGVLADQNPLVMAGFRVWPLVEEISREKGKKAPSFLVVASKVPQEEYTEDDDEEEEEEDALSRLSRNDGTKKRPFTLGGGGF